MPSLIDTESRTGCLVNSINLILADDGLAGLTLRNIAKVSGVSTSSMLHDFGSREHLLRVAAHETGTVRLSDAESDLRSLGAAALLPENTAYSLRWARAWLSWCDLWRSADWLFRTMEQARQRERALLARSLVHPVERDRLDGFVAMVDGLTLAVCQPVDPMSIAAARSVLDEQAAVVRRYAGAAASAAARSFPTISSGSSAE